MKRTFNILENSKIVAEIFENPKEIIDSRLDGAAKSLRWDSSLIRSSAIKFCVSGRMWSIPVVGSNLVLVLAASRRQLAKLARLALFFF